MVVNHMVATEANGTGTSACCPAYLLKNSLPPNNSKVNRAKIVTEACPSAPDLARMVTMEVGRGEEMVMMGDIVTMKGRGH